MHRQRTKESHKFTELVEEFTDLLDGEAPRLARSSLHRLSHPSQLGQIGKSLGIPKPRVVLSNPQHGPFFHINQIQISKRIIGAIAPAEQGHLNGISIKTWHRPPQST